MPDEEQRLATGLQVLVRKPMDDDTSPTGSKLTSCYSSTKTGRKHKHFKVQSIMGASFSPGVPVKEV